MLFARALQEISRYRIALINFRNFVSNFFYHILIFAAPLLGACEVNLKKFFAADGLFFTSGWLCFRFGDLMFSTQKDFLRWPHLGGHGVCPS